MVSTLKEYYKLRNRVFGIAIDRYPDIISFFKEFSLNRYDNELADFRNRYSDQYFKLKRYIGVDQASS